MFPTDLMIVKRTKNGIVRPVFLSSDSSDLARSVISFMKSSVNHNMDYIDRGRKEIEVRSRNHKVIRGLFLITERMSKFKPPSDLDAYTIRKKIFSRTPIPVLDQTQRMKIFMEIAAEIGTDTSSVEKAMYGDKESDQILIDPPETDPEELCRLFNLEQVETILMHSVSMDIFKIKDWHTVLKRIKSLGLLCTIKTGGNEIQSISVSGPMSVLERSERYGIRMARIFRSICRERQWEIEATIMLKERDSGGKKTYSFRAGDEISDYFPEFSEDEDKPDSRFPVVFNTDPVAVPGGVFVPYCSLNLGEREILINLSVPQSIDEDRKIRSYLSGNGILMENVYLLFGSDKKIKGEICFRDSIGWEELIHEISARYPGWSTGNEIKKEKNENPDKMIQIKQHLDITYPDSEKMLDIIEEAGLSPLEVLETLGYTVTWKGLSMIVQKKNSSGDGKR
ncbi:DUF790 family protein [Oxyplasma meridianum]|uniref:DUF790 family protein n=1 Tax=Oxyplasma meridianum TaxID=3073602 RepID=A0AAX4NFY6_9ARCH